MEQLLSGIRSLLPFRPNIEITLEANPGTFEQEKFKGFREAGINRLSVGIQSFNSQHLQALGRVHNQAEALKAAEVARYAGFDNFNLDLMFGLPKQSLEQALADLQQAIDLAPTHLSWYQLTLEPNTLFYKHPPVLPDDDLLVDMQYAGQALLEQNAYQQYEVSAYAQSQRECRHNLNYWEFGDYLGIGAGAHGKITDPFGQVTRHQKYRQPTQYLQQVKAGQARSDTQILTSADLSFEFMLNALRLKRGFDLALLTERTGLALETLQRPLGLAQKRGWIELKGNRVVTTELGWQFLNTVIQLFLED
jgi:oxygen-independent coproporphyrinogen-3 oxidase